MSQLSDVWIARNGESDSEKVLARKALSPYVEICTARACVNNMGGRCNGQTVQIDKDGKCRMFVQLVKDDN